MEFSNDSFSFGTSYAFVNITLGFNLFISFLVKVVGRSMLGNSVAKRRVDLPTHVPTC